MKPLLEAWVGGGGSVSVPLEKTDMYGIRTYTRGARLLSHLDRESTHAVSLIINIVTNLH